VSIVSFSKPKGARMPESEQANTRVLPPIVWGEGYAQPCLTGCGNVLAHRPA
jgi:hypothetical protein